MRRIVSTGFTSLVGWLLAALCATPAVAHSIQFLWQATGTDSIAVLPGSEVVLEVWVEVDSPGIVLASVSALATPGLLEASDWQVCPTPCTTDGLGFLDGPLGAGSIVLNQQDGIPGLSGSFAAADLPVGVPPGSFLLAEIIYQVIGVGSGEVLPFYRPGIDGVVEVDSTFLLPLANGADITSGASFQVVPEPGTAALLAFGLGGLALRRRADGHR